MFPYKDDNPTERPAVVTVGIIALNVLAFILLQGAGAEAQVARSVCDLGLIPGEILGTARPGAGVQLAPGMVCVVESAPKYWTVLTSMFMHGGWFHIVGNLWFLWVFGNNVEDVMGRARFVVFYVLCGLAAAAAQTFSNPSSAIPMVGASGAIGGVMGAYAFLYPRAHVHTLIILGFYMRTVAVPASFMLGYWFLLQILGGLPKLGSEGGGVAFWAHVGGFVAGVVLVYVFRKPELVAAHRALSARPRFA